MIEPTVFIKEFIIREAKQIVVLEKMLIKDAINVILANKRFRKYDWTAKIILDLINRIADLLHREKLSLNSRYESKIDNTIQADIEQGEY